jgi:hypothetical protein
VVLHGQLAVGAFDFLLACASLYTQDFVVIAFCIGCQTAILTAEILLLGTLGYADHGGP